MKKKLGVLAILSCLGVLFLYGFGNERIKAATEKDEPEINIFQSVSIAKYDSKTKKVSDSLKDGENVNYDELFQLEYHVVIPAEIYKEVDQPQDFSIEIPEFVPVTMGEAQPVKNEQGDNLGSWKILDDSTGKKTLIFRANEKFEELVDQEFEIKFYASLNQTKMKNQNQDLNIDFKTVKDSQISLKIIEIKSASNQNSSDILDDNVSSNDYSSIGKTVDSNVEISGKYSNGLARIKDSEYDDTFDILIIGRDSLNHDQPVNGLFVIYNLDDLEGGSLEAAISSNGRVAFREYPEGNYRIVGGKSRDDLYFMPNNVNYVDIHVPSEDGDIKVYLDYLQGWGGIRLYKQDAETKQSLSGAEFKLVKYEYNEPHVIKEGLVTNEAGVIQIEELYAGEYAFIETKAPEGYVLDSTPVPVEIVPDLLSYPDRSRYPLYWDTMNQATMGNEIMKVTMDSSKLPGNLDFGSHKIQYKQDETYTASDSSNAQTEGEITIKDTRDSGGWTLKVKQNAEFKHTDSTNLSDNTSLTIDIGTVTNSNSKLPSSLVSSVSLQPNDEKKIAMAQANEGSGKTIIPLEKFSLTVPKNSSKKVGQYDSSLIWTLSDVPEG